MSLCLFNSAIDKIFVLLIFALSLIFIFLMEYTKTYKIDLSQHKV